MHVSLSRIVTIQCVNFAEQISKEFSVMQTALQKIGEHFENMLSTSGG